MINSAKRALNMPMQVLGLKSSSLFAPKAPQRTYDSHWKATWIFPVASLNFMLSVHQQQWTGARGRKKKRDIYMFHNAFYKIWLKPTLDCYTNNIRMGKKFHFPLLVSWDNNRRSRRQPPPIPPPIFNSFLQKTIILFILFPLLLCTNRLFLF